MTETETKFEQWAIVEIFGHNRFAGRVSEETVGGCSFVRVDVPTTDGGEGFTKLFGQGAIYAITFVSEEIARQLAFNLRKRPVDVYELTPDMQKRLPLSDRDDDPRDDDEEAWHR